MAAWIFLFTSIAVLHGILLRSATGRLLFYTQNHKGRFLLKVYSSHLVVSLMLCIVLHLIVIVFVIVIRAIHSAGVKMPMALIDVAPGQSHTVGQ